MTSEELSQELKDNLAKIDGILNIIRSSPAILAYNKLLGLQQKLSILLVDIEGKTPKQETNEDSKE